MNLATRLRTLERSVPACDEQVRRVVLAGDGPVEAEACPRCGRDHTVVVTKVIVTAATAEDDPTEQGSR